MSADSPGLPAPSLATTGAAVHWRDVETAAPDLAAAVLGRFTAAKHHVLATLTRDGSPRVSGTEVDLWRGDLLLGSMPGARKAQDLLRDGRFALHAHTGDGSLSDGDAKVAGRVEQVTDPGELADFVHDRHPPEPFLLFRCLLTSVVLTDLEGERMRIRTLRPGAGPTTVHRP
jgi:hypothetical protein